jgi:hypothetical protein
MQNYLAIVLEDDKECQSNRDYLYQNAQVMNIWQRSVLVRNVPKEYEAALRLTLENDAQGGGELVDYQNTSEGVMVTFADPAVAQGLINKKNVMFFEKNFKVESLPIQEVEFTSMDHLSLEAADTYTVSPAYKPASSPAESKPMTSEEDQPSGFVLHVQDVDKDAVDIFLILLENEGRGGGQIVSHEWNEVSKTLTVHFKDKEVLDFMMLQESLRILKNMCRPTFSDVPVSPKADSSLAERNDGLL